MSKTLEPTLAFFGRQKIQVDETNTTAIRRRPRQVPDWNEAEPLITTYKA